MMTEPSVLKVVLDLSTRWAIFPCRDKRPLTPHGLKDATQDQAQVRGWWTRWPDAQIGVPVGENTGSFVLDIDQPDGPASLAALEAEHAPLPPTWTATTPSGGTHMHFTLPAGLVLKNSASRLGPGLDIRAEGGYVIVEPSPGYVWTSSGVGLADAPPWLLELLTAPKAPPAAPAHNAATTPYGRAGLDSESARVALAPQGSRNQTLNAAAFAVGKLVAGGEVDRSEAEPALLYAALRAGLSETEASKTIASGMGAGEQEPRKPEGVNIVSKAALASASSVSSASYAGVSGHQHPVSNASADASADASALVEDFIEQSTGIFTISELCQWCGLTSRDQRNAVSAKLLRLKTKNKIERVGARHGHWRRVESECQAMDFKATPETPLDIKLPFSLERLVETMPGSLIVVAGESNSGKTALLLNLIRANQDRLETHYFNSEMSSGELKKRLSKFPCPLNSWAFSAWERSSDFADVVRPDALNIIDFLEIAEDFYKVGGQLAAIHRKLSRGVAVVALQKNPGIDLGLGGARSLEKARLYLSLSPGRIKVIKAKLWATEQNPNGMQLDFKIVQGCQLIASTGWYRP